MLNELSEEINIQRACQLLSFSRSSYYEKRNRQESNRSKGNKTYSDLILSIHIESGRRYGAPKIHHELTKKGVFISLKRVQKLMKSLAIQSIVVKKCQPCSTSSEKIDARENLLNQDFSTTTINQKWVTDITYIHTSQNGWCYLSSIQDLHSKKIIAWSFGKKMTTALVLDTLEKAQYKHRIERKSLFFTPT